MSGFGRLVPGAVRRRLLDLKPRLDDLESAVRSLDAVIDALLLSPLYEPGEVVGFNGQLRRKELFADILTAVAIEAIVETGTWLGNTAAYMAETSGRTVYSCEVNPRYHAVARKRLANVSGVHLELSDSREFLAQMSGKLRGQSVFFYLDAHWYREVLVEELQTILSSWNRFVVMIDDCVVSGDVGYEYDTHGAGRPLGLHVFGDLVARHGARAFYPAAHSSTETGRKRGCVVLAPAVWAERLGSLASLRPA